MWSVGCILAELIRHKETAEFGEREVQQRIEKGGLTGWRILETNIFKITAPAKQPRGSGEFHW